MHQNFRAERMQQILQCGSWLRTLALTRYCMIFYLLYWAASQERKREDTVFNLPLSLQLGNQLVFPLFASGCVCTYRHILLSTPGVLCGSGTYFASLGWSQAGKWVAASTVFLYRLPVCWHTRTKTFGFLKALLWRFSGFRGKDRG